MSTTQNKLKRRKYPSDISENGWKKLKPYLLQAQPPKQMGSKQVGRGRADLKEVLNGIMYVVKSGCSWRSGPDADARLLVRLMIFLIGLPGTATSTVGVKVACGK